MISAKIIADSAAPHGGRIITYSLCLPRPVLSEFNTHKALSRNASSSRAIPVKKMLAMVYSNPFVPIHFGANQKGMQADAELQGWRRSLARRLWLLARFPAMAVVVLLNAIGLHKQIANRLLEPWLWAFVVCTGTDFANFFALRYHGMAEPHMQLLAQKMWEARAASTPTPLKAGEWHLPYLDAADRACLVLHLLTVEQALKMSTARCARVSYLNHEGKSPTYKEDADLFQRLVGSDPKHASPSEHQAMAVSSAIERSGNLTGFIQHRKLLPNENITTFRGVTC